MKKIIAIFATAVLVANVAMAGGAKDATSGASTNGNASAGSKASAGATKHAPVTIKFPTATASGALYAVGAAIANMWDSKIDFVSASSQASNGGVDNLNQIADGESQVGIAISSNCLQSYKGTDVFAGNANPKLRVIAGLYFNPNQVVVTQKSGITSVAGVRGKHFAVAAAGSSVEGECSNHFTAAGLNYPSDIRAEYIAFGDAADMLQNGTIDGAWIMSGTPAAAVSQACSAGCVLVDVDDALLAKLQATYPWYARYTIPAGTYPGQTRDVKTSAIKMVMFTSADLDEETIYQMTKTLWENIGELGEAQRNLTGLTAKAAVEDIAGLPLHDGAARYYKEIGVIK